MYLKHLCRECGGLLVTEAVTDESEISISVKPCGTCDDMREVQKLRDEIENTEGSTNDEYEKAIYKRCVRDLESVGMISSHDAERMLANIDGTAEEPISKFTPGRILSNSEAIEALESGFILKCVREDTKAMYHQWLWVDKNGQLLSHVRRGEIGMSNHWSKKHANLSGEFTVCDDEFCKTPQEHALNKRRKEELLEYWAGIKFGFR